MKIVSFLNKPNKIDQATSAAIKEGRWWHVSRKEIIRGKTQAAVVSMNIFERAISILLELFFDYKSYAFNRLVTQIRPAGHLGPITNKPTPIFTPSSERVEKAVIPIFPEVSAAPPRVSPIDTEARKEIVQIYRSEQEQKGEPVDLIIGRGGKNNPSYPKLVEKRNFLDKGLFNYHPFLVDVDESVDPDLVANITDATSMQCFDDASFDEIYLERIFPRGPLLNIMTYWNAARILKPGGTLIIDAVELCTKNDLKKCGQIIKEVLTKYQIPFDLSYVPGPRSDSTSWKIMFMRYPYGLPHLKTKMPLTANNELQKAFLRTIPQVS